MRGTDVISRPPALNMRALPPLDPIRKGIDRVMVRWPDVIAIPEERDRERLAQEMLRRVTDWDWEDVKTSRIIACAVAVFDLERCDRADLKGVRDFYLIEIAVCDAGSLLDGMVMVYIDSFNKDSSHSRALAKALAERQNAFGPRIQTLLSSLPALFNVKQAPIEVANVMLAAQDPYQALKDIGLRAPHTSGLTHQAHRQFVQKIRKDLCNDETRKQLFRWLSPEMGTVLQTDAGMAIEALLAAWRTKTPPDKARHEMSEAIVGAYNDPRLHRGGIWASFDPELRAVLLRWLTKQDMKFFCDMVTATQDSHMWPPRRDFWLLLYEDGMIDEAWVAFGKKAQQYARQQLKRASSVDVGRRFGRQISGEDKSLLIMRIGNKIVVDGCHSYKTHIFRSDDPKAPKLYSLTYDSNRIRANSRLSQTHYWSERNKLRTWEEWVMRHV